MILLWIAIILLFLSLIRNKEGFDPFLHDTIPMGYPDQSKFGDIILAEKYIYKQMKSPNTTSTKVAELTDLLNLLQFIG